MLALFITAAAFAGDTASPDEAALADMAPCEGAWIEFTLPPDGAEGVSPDAVPGVGVRADCGASDIMAVITGPADEVQSTVVTVSSAGIVRFPELDLTADGSWFLEVQSGTSDGETFWAYDGLQAAFTTGTGGVEPLAAAPTLEVLGSDYDPTSEAATFSLHVVTSGAAGNAWEVSAVDGRVVAYGVVGEADLVVAAAGAPGEEVCFMVNEYLPDGQVGGTSDPACGTIESKVVDVCGCLQPSAEPTAAAGALLGLVALSSARRRRR